MAETGWLVELGCDPPMWWKGQTPERFTMEVADAIRFARFEDAERARLYLVAKGEARGCRSIQHAFVPVSSPPADPE